MEFHRGAGVKISWFQSVKQLGVFSSGAHAFCFPYAGGSATSLRPLEETVNPEISLHLATLPGRGRRFGEPATSDISVLVNGFCDAIERIAPQRFVLFGHSMGGILAFEVARALRRRRNRFKPVALVASGVSAPHLFAREEKEHRYNLPRDEFVDYLRELEGTPPELLEHKEALDVMLPTLRRDFELCDNYRFVMEAPLSVPIVVLSGEDDHHVQGKKVTDWSLHTTTGCRVHRFSGGHFFLNDHWEEIGALLGELLQAELPENL